jgi:hypothetical protein
MKATIKSRVGFGLTSVVLAVATALVAPATAQAAPQTYTGSGDAVVDITPIKSASILKVTFTGDSAFIVRPIDATGKEGVSLVIDIGPFDGTVFQQAVSKAVVALSVKAEGDWTIAISPIATAPIVGTKNVSGTGSAVVKWAKPSTGYKKIAFTSDGDGAFIVRPIDSKGKERISMILNVGAYNGSVLLPTGTQYLKITSNGNWNFTVK